MIKTFCFCIQINTIVWNNLILVKLKLNLKVRIIRLFGKKNSEFDANLQNLKKELKIKLISRKSNLLKYYF